MQMARRSCWLLLAVIIIALPGASFAQVAISVSFGPPALPVYTQPICPGVGYIWVPGYWAWDPNFGDYYWVPGTWVLAPQVGYLWTPPWWGWSGGAYLFHAGYWGPTIGFYGGINYGWGYFGHGYEGGRWNNGQFYYNRSVNNINVTNIHNVYNVNVVNNNTYNRVSYNGGPGGVAATPTAAEQAADREKHIPPVAAQTQHLDAARANPQLRASANQGKPPIAATDKPTEFKGSGAVPARAAGAPYHPPAKTEANANRPPNETAARPENTPASHNVPRPPTPIHAANLPPHQAPAPTSTANTEAEKQYQQRQQQLAAQENAEHEKLAQQQEAEHQKMAQQHASNAQIQQMEQQHQQQTRQLQESHQQQERQMERQAPPPSHTEARPPAPAKH